jgi:DNA repair protein RadC
MNNSRAATVTKETRAASGLALHIDEPRGLYRAAGVVNDEELDIIEQAIDILRRRFETHSPILEAPELVMKFVLLKTRPLGQEVIGALWLDTHHRLITSELLAVGTLTQSAVYPREVVKRALQLNAAAVIIFHNHPSGVPEPSRADEHMTQTLRQALSVVDVRLLDHIVAGASHCVSFVQRGLI